MSQFTLLIVSHFVRRSFPMRAIQGPGYRIGYRQVSAKYSKFGNDAPYCIVLYCIVLYYEALY